MQIGAVFPQLEIGNDPAIIARWATEVERLGYRHIVAYDHVVGANADTRPGWRGYTHADQFHEVFVLFGYLAAITDNVELVTGVLILPQRQTALVAKQAAEVAVLNGGRLRLGIGVGWNPVEYDVLGERFSDRGARSEEQIRTASSAVGQTVDHLRGPLAPRRERRDQPAAARRPHPRLDRRNRRTRPAPCGPNRRWLDAPGSTGLHGRGPTESHP